MIVKVKKPIEFINDCNCIVDQEELERAINWYSAKPSARLKKIYLHGRYPAVSIYKEKIHVHRLLMMFWEGRILRTNDQVHHKDENKLNASKNNLEIVSAGDHQSMHKKGKEFTQIHRDRIALSNRRRAGNVKYKKRANIPIDDLKSLLNKGMSLNKIAKHFKCDWSTIKRRLDENPELSEQTS